MALLHCENISVNYGAIKALKNIELVVNMGEIVTLIGSNGAGKSTTMRTIMGLKHCDQGKISYDGEDITNIETRHIVKRRIILSPEGRQIFPRFSVLDNLKMGAYTRPDNEISDGLDSVFVLFPKLRERVKQEAGTLSGGEQQMLALGRAMMAKPRLLLLDEPSLGLAPLLVKEIFSMILRIRDIGTTILLVEQNARVALRHSDRAYVLETGKIVLHGTAQELLESDMVQQAYLGGV